ncbi:MAG: hypothetical protein AB8F94_28140 [Saprospiraceae bacterium]
MELKLKPSKINVYPTRSFLIRNTSAKEWVLELQRLKISLQEVQIFPIPNITANSIWGCFVITHQNLKSDQVEKNQLCQTVFSNFFIAEKSTLLPNINDSDKTILFAEGIYIFHPEFGIVKLEEQVNFEKLISTPTDNPIEITQPEESAFQPKRISSFYIQPESEEDILENLEKITVPKREKIPHQPLNFFEKGRLAFYKNFFSSKKDKEELTGSEKTEFGEKVDSFLNSVSDGKNNTIEDWQEDYENLEERNQKQLDKLLKMLNDNPEEALKYAIPLDPNNSSRGGSQGSFTLNKRWGDLSAFGSGSWSGGGGGSIDLGDGYLQLEEQYRKTALVLIAKKEYEKAAFVYLKLLKNPYQAAMTLENGKLYKQAAAIYLKHLNNKIKAAECYEKGNMTYKAIELYEEIEYFSKVGDLYLTLHKRELANQYFTKHANVLMRNSKYFHAAAIFQNKIEDLNGAQNILLEGWEKNFENYQCLIKYYDNITDAKVLKNQYDYIYHQKLTDTNKMTFLKVVEHEFKNKRDLQEHLKNIGYEIIAQEAAKHPHVVHELKKFNLEDKEIVKDISRFKNG